MPISVSRTTPSLPRGHESSPLRSPRDSDDTFRQWKRHNASTAQVSNDRLAINQLAQKVEGLRRRILGGIPEFPIKWQEPKELDPDFAVDAGTLVYISPNNDLVLTGLTDEVTSTTVQAYPGIWLAAKDIPPVVAGVYNVPTTDYPSTTPSGSPLRGDLDDDDVYWILICPTCNL